MARTVLLVADNLGLSGKTKALADLALGLDSSRYRAEVCVMEEEESPLPRLLSDAGIILHRVPAPKGLDPRALLGFSRLIRRVRPAVVHCYNPRPMLYAGSAARLAGVRGVLGSLSAFACQVPDREYSFLPTKLHTASVQNKLRNRALAKIVGAFAVVSGLLGERFCRWNGISPDKLRVVPYGVRLAETTPAERAEMRAAARRDLGIGEGDLLVGSVGRLVEQKDYPTQLRGFAHAAAAEPRLRMALAGAGPLAGELGRLAGELGIADRVTFLGHRSDVPRLLAAFDVFVMTSKFEPFGVALLEAKAAACAIVATEVNEIPEIIPAGRAGLLFPAGDDRAFSARLLALAADAELRARLAAEALREAREKHSLRAMIDRYQGLYDELGPST